MWYKNIAGTFFGLITKHACDRQTDGRTDRITTPKTALAQLRRAVKKWKIVHAIAHLCVFIVLISAAYYTFLICFWCILYDNKTKVTMIKQVRRKLKPSPLYQRLTNYTEYILH